MPIAVRRAHRHKRQDDAATALTSVDGLSGEATITAGASLNTALVFDTSASGSPESITAPLVESSTIVVTEKPTSSSQSTPSSVLSSARSTGSAAAQASSSDDDDPIPMGAVIGACIGAFAMLGLLVLLVLWCGKRNKPRGTGVRTTPSPLANTRNAAGEDARRQSHLQPWSRLEEGEEREKVDGDAVSYDEKFNMFTKTPSVRSAYEKTSEGHSFQLPPVQFETVQFEKYHPGLAEELSSQGGSSHGQLLGHTDSQPSSWARDTIGDDSFLSLRSIRISTNGNGFSPATRDISAIPTPPATVSGGSHYWESAVVVTPDQTEGDQNPFADQPPRQRRKSSVGNPFFNAQELVRKRSSSNSRAAARRSSHLLNPIANNPFTDDSELPPPPPALVRPSIHDSTVSLGTGRAMQSLIAALELPEEEVQERLRVASMQPSVLSRASTYADDDAMSVGSFPLPPDSSAMAGSPAHPAR